MVERLKVGKVDVSVAVGEATVVDTFFVAAVDGGLVRFSDYDALKTDYDRLRDGIRQWAAECTYCDGTGTLNVARGLRPLGAPCPDCADIVALLEPKSTL